MPTSFAERSLAGSLAAHESWANTPDRAARTAPARAALLARFEREVDPDNLLEPAERGRRAEHKRKAYFQRLALRSAQSRRKSREARQLADDLDRIAESADADLANPDAAA